MKKLGLILLSLLLFVLLVVPGEAAAGSDYAPGQLLVKFAQGFDPESVLSDVDGGYISRGYINLPQWKLVELPQGMSVKSAQQAYTAHTGIIHAEPNYRYTIMQTPNDMRFNEQWALYNMGQSGGTPGADISAPEAWSIRTSAADIVVAVLDTGIDYTHIDLMGNMWTSDQGFHGYNFVEDNDDPFDDHGHGTHVAGTIGAVTNNQIGVAGVCWDVQLMALRVLGTDGSGYAADIIAGIDFAVENGAHVINASLGGFGRSAARYDAIVRANEAGIIFVAAAGNNNMNNDIIPYYPAGYDVPNVVSVMSTDHNDARSGFSNYGRNSVHLAAPGSNILSTIPGNAYAQYSGTSMAAPHVAGALALMLAANNQQAENLTHLEIIDILLLTTDRLDQLATHCQTGGRLNLHFALQNIIEDRIPPEPNPPVWQIEPTATGIETIYMRSVLLRDEREGPVEYYFDCITDPNISSGWQSSRAYEVTGLDEGTSYTWRVRGRDESGNETEWSQEVTATTATGTDNLPPAPSPSRWFARPAPGAGNRLSMQAVESFDENAPVEYYFECVTDSAFDSGWQESTLYRFSPPDPEQSYTFRVRARDALGNETEWSTEASGALRTPSPRTREVPGTYHTIQAAINAANDGDTVVVSPGTYSGPGNRNLDFLGKSITVRSTNPESQTVVASTIINAGGGETGEPQTSHRGFIFQNGEDPNSVLAGFTIRNGYIWTDAAWPINPPAGSDGVDGPDSFGGGILCIGGSSPTIRNVVVEDCVVRGGAGTPGIDGEYPDDIWNNEEDFAPDAYVIYFDEDGVDRYFIPLAEHTAGGDDEWDEDTTYEAGDRVWIGAPNADTFICIVEESTEGEWIAGEWELDNDEPLVGNNWENYWQENETGLPRIHGGRGGHGGDAYGAGIYADGQSSPIIIDSIFRNNWAVSGVPAEGADGADSPGNGLPPGRGGVGGSAGWVQGAGVYYGNAVTHDPNSSRVTITGTRIESNIVEHHPGATGGNAGAPSHAYAGPGGSSRYRGIGLFVGSGHRSSHLAGVRIEGNFPESIYYDFNPYGTPNQGAGAFFGLMLGSSAVEGVNLTNCRIRDNESRGPGAGLYIAGGIEDDPANVRIVSSVIERNIGPDIAGTTIGYSGGGAFIGDERRYTGFIDMPMTILTIEDSVFADNEARTGAGLYTVNVVGDSRISNSVIADNIAGRGGGMFMDLGQIDIADSDFAGNVANSDGGGLVISNSVATLSNTRIWENTAIAGSGGGVYWSHGGGYGDQKMVNCLVFDNHAGRSGGGVGVYMDAWVTLENCTIADNRADYSGGGISCAEGGAWAEVVSSILWDNSAPYGFGTQIAIGLRDGSNFDPWAWVDVINSTVMDGIDEIWLEGPETELIWDNSITADPLFAVTTLEDQTRNYFLSQYDPDVDGPQLEDSPALHAGLGDIDDLETEIGMPLTTRTDLEPYTGTVHMGYHYPRTLEPLTFELVIDVVHGYGGTVTPYEPNTPAEPVVHTVTAGKIAELFAVPWDPTTDLEHGAQWRLLEWTGTDWEPVLDPDDPDYNTVTMYEDRHVTVEFEPVDRYKLLTRVIAGDGTVTPGGLTLQPQDTVVRLRAYPDNPAVVTRWDGTDDDLTRSTTNQVTMDDHKVVDVDFYMPRILHVQRDSDYPNIQRAIDEAEDDDIILLAPDTYHIYDEYYTNVLIIEDKIITIRGDGETPEDTLIVGGFIITDVDRRTIIENLTITANYGGVTGLNASHPGNPSIHGMNGYHIAGGGMQLHNYYWDIGNTELPPIALPDPNSGSPTVRNVIFEDCSVQAGHGGHGDQPGGHGGWGGWAHGGAVSVGPDSNPLFENVRFINNTAIGGDGGNGNQSTPWGLGGSWGDETDERWYWVPIGGYRPYWKYSGYGGAVYIDTNSTPDFINCYFEGNTAIGGSSGLGGGGQLPNHHYRLPRFGGAVYVAEGAAPRFIDTVFVDNEADIVGQAEHRTGAATDTHPNTQNFAYGGALALDDESEPVLYNVVIDGNLAHVGGGIYSHFADPYITEFSITNNSARTGGGIALSGGNSRIGQGELYRNEATGQNEVGGAIMAAGANMMLVDATIGNNIAEGIGGGIYISSSDVDGEPILGWRKTEEGQANSVLIQNCLIHNNRAGGSGGGIAAHWHADPNIVNTTIADNLVADGYGGGISVAYGTYLNVLNSIVWGNATTYGRQIAIRDDLRPSTVEVSYSNVQGGGAFVTNYSGGDIWVSTNSTLVWDEDTNLTGTPEFSNPLFISGARGSYYLSNTLANQDYDSPVLERGQGTADQLPFGPYPYTTRIDDVMVYDRDAQPGDPNYREIDLGFHFRKAGEFATGDINHDGVINYEDVSLLTPWLGEQGCTFPDWCKGRDLNRDGRVDMVDYAILSSMFGAGDVMPPSPNPSRWAIPPSPAGTTSAWMRATQAHDNSRRDVYYYFECVTHPGLDSGWQLSRDYIAEGLDPYDPEDPNTEYGFRVRAADFGGEFGVGDPNELADRFDPYAGGAGNKTEWSYIGYTVAGDDAHWVSTPPVNLQWIIRPHYNLEGNIIMQGSAQHDQWEVEYFYENIDTGTTSGWIEEPGFWTDVWVTPGQTHRYRFMTRNTAPQQDQSNWSSVMTVAQPDTDPPTDLEWVTGPGWVEDWGEDELTGMFMIVSAQDAGLIEYQFERVGTNVNTGWIEQDEDGLGVWLDMAFGDDDDGDEVAYRFRARDQFQNVSEWSEIRLAVVGEVIDMEPPVTGAWPDDPYRPHFELPGPRYELRNDGYWHTMTAMAAEDESDPVEYRFLYYCTERKRILADYSSGWQEDTYYEVYMRNKHDRDLWLLQTRDSSVNQNVSPDSYYYSVVPPDEYGPFILNRPRLSLSYRELWPGWVPPDDE